MVHYKVCIFIMRHLTNRIVQDHLNVLMGRSTVHTGPLIWIQCRSGMPIQRPPLPPHSLDPDPSCAAWKCSGKLHEIQSSSAMHVVVCCVELMWDHIRSGRLHVEEVVPVASEIHGSYLLLLDKFIGKKE